jgi:hypothetical protein
VYEDYGPQDVDLATKEPAVATGMTLVAAMAVQKNAASAVWREADSRSLDVP